MSVNGLAQTDPEELPCEILQKAHLSQKVRTMLCVLENFDKLLKVIQNYITE